MPTASLRSPDNYNIPEALKQSHNSAQKNFDTHLFQKFGGHPQAAGFSLLEENLDLARNLFEEAILDQQKTQSKKSKINYCHLQKVPIMLEIYKYKKEVIWLNEEDIDTELLTDIWKLEPFGQDFSLPLLGFCYTNFDFDFFGTEGQHLRLKTVNGVRITFFNIKSGEKDKIGEGIQLGRFWIIAKPSLNFWNGKTNSEMVGEIWAVD